MDKKATNKLNKEYENKDFFGESDESTSYTFVPVEAFHEVEEAGDRNSLEVNLLIHAENSHVMSALKRDYGGKIDLIYLDPPFDIGSDISIDLSFGEHSSKSAPKSNLFRAIAYGDHWKEGSESYLEMLQTRLLLCKELLSERGSLYLHCDYRSTAYMRLILEEIFGKKNYINECIWHYKTGGMPEKLGYGRKHDTIHFVVKDPNKAIWHPQKEKSYLGHKYGFKNIEIEKDERGHYTWTNLRDVWIIPALRGNQPEKVDYPTQKPEALLERIILASSDKDSIVADFFCGSGTTGVVAERLGRRWIMCDQGDLAIHTCRKRLLELHSEVKNKNATARHFLILEAQEDETSGNLSKLYTDYKESYIEKVFEVIGASREETGLFQGRLKGNPCYLVDLEKNATKELVLKLEQSLSEMGEETGWCISFNFDEKLTQEFTRNQAIRLIQVPKEFFQQGRKSAPVFYEIPLCKFEVLHQLDDSYDVHIIDYVPAATINGNNRNDNLKQNPSDFIDMWAIDFDYIPGKHFHYDWCDFRSRGKRSLELSSSAHWKYSQAGIFTIAAKIVDVSGVETVSLQQIKING
ncbi:MAG: site-specific DNA-methyltransferase [SAR324 cluster bacterium]|uniref:Site-specific DNA-methyltransferase n=1 Tax=SAR324 cluster bacterium TaxID=2024889 RepID=A0A7X9III5_9DELT|nr:site-specific DNA-methyltransferase [SAR324 cluster bacterium]